MLRPYVGWTGVITAYRRSSSPGPFAQERALQAPRRGDASVFRSACHREGTPARFGSAIVTTEASPGLFAQERTLYAPRRGDASVFRSACHRDGTPARFGSAIVR